LTQAAENLTISRDFIQENNIDFLRYQGKIADFNEDNLASFNRTIVDGEFKGLYDGGHKTISNAVIVSFKAEKLAVFA
ncbi:MAG: hypothetical protein RR396_07180, partial [Clostridiales bacterium]